MTRKFEGADQESLDLLKKMKDRGIESSYDRYDAQRMQTRLRRGILSVMLLPVLLHIPTMAGQLPSFSSQRQGARPKATG